MLLNFGKISSGIRLAEENHRKFVLKLLAMVTEVFDIARM